MKIVKEFEDPEVLRLLYHWCAEEDLDGSYFFWGLGDNGELYCRSDRFRQDNWFEIAAVSGFQGMINLKIMKRIVKEFGHLVVFT